MLVLGAMEGDTIHVGEVSVTLIRSGSNRVRLGFTAPPEVQIEREKVRNRRLKTTNVIPPASLPDEYR